MWLRLELRRRWRALLVLALLVALSTGVVLTAVAGARRADSAGPRLLARTLPADAVALPNQPGFDWAPIRALPEVAALSTFPVFTPAVAGIPPESAGFPPADDQFMNTIERPVVLAGRLADPARVDESVVTANFVRSYGLGVGDTVTYRLYTPESADTAGDASIPPPPDGPSVASTIVGVVRSPWLSDPVGAPGGITPSAGLYAQYTPNILGTGNTTQFINALVRLRGGEADLPLFRADLARITGRTDIDVWNQADLYRKLQKTDTFEAGSLLAFGIAALAAAIVLVGQAAARYSAAALADLGVLRALGMSPRLAVTTAAAGPGLAALLGSAAGVAAAIVASAWMPIGSAANVEPAPGIDIDPLVLSVGGLAAPLLVAGAGALAARIAVTAGRDEASPRRSAVAVAAARLGLPVPVVVGMRFALEPGRGRTAVPVRPALLGAVVGVLGVLAAFTFSAGVADAAANPERFGRTYQLEGFVGFNGQDFGPAKPALSVIAADPEVAGTNDALVAVATIGGTGPESGSATLYSHDPVGAPVTAVLTAGRMAAADGEIVLGPATAAAARAGVGSTVEVVGNLPEPRRMTVSGIGFVPTGPHNTYDDGGWVTPGGFAALFDGFKFHQMQVQLRPGVDVTAAADRLSHAVGAALGTDPLPLTPPVPMAEVAQIRDVQVLPVVLGAFLAALALGAVGHALATAVRRRRHDLAVLRAHGMTRWQARGVVVTQASVLAVTGLLFGIPLGIALGRTLWALVADITPLKYQAPVAVLALVLVVPVVVVAANTLAAWPGHQAARLRIGHVLRAE